MHNISGSAFGSRGGGLADLGPRLFAMLVAVVLFAPAVFGQSATPKQAVDHVTAAMLRGDRAAIMNHVLRMDRAKVDTIPQGQPMPSGSSFRTEDAVVDGDVALVPATVSIGGQGSRDAAYFTVRIDGSWYVALTVSLDRIGRSQQRPGTEAGLRQLIADVRPQLANAVPLRGPSAAAPTSAVGNSVTHSPGIDLQAGGVRLMSWFKPVLFLAVLIGWGWVVSHLDKDAAYYYLQREWLNLGQLAVGALGFAVMLLVPWFLLGFPLGLAILGGGIVGYAAYRNQKVPEEKQWTFSLASFTQKYDDYQHSKSQRAATMALLDTKDNRIDVPTGEDPNVQAHLVFEQAMEFALQRNADRVQVAVDSTQAVMKVLIDGIPYTQPAIEPKLALHMVDYLKQAAGLDVSDRRKRQMAHFGVDAGELGRHKLRLETAGSTRGVMLSMDIDHARRLRIPLKSLGLLDSQMQQLTAALDRRGGVVLVAAPPHQGTTTALYSLLEAHDPYTTSVVTMEQEVAYEAEGVNHNLMEEGLSPQLFNEKLSATLRSDPGVVMLDQLPDAETARIIAHASIDQQTRFYAPLAEPDTFTALRRWLKLVADRRLAGEGLAAVVSERLVRKLCTTCRSPYTPDPAALKKLNLPADRVTQLFQASGKVMVKDKERPCPACYGIGYRGRVAVFEVMAIDNTAQAIIAEGDLDKLRSHLRKQRMLWLQEAALARVVEGATDIGEVTRALNNQAASGRSRTSASAGARKAPDAEAAGK